jgi:diadenosine tetraphosphate (Ap4A) HIT family hydrolase
MNAPIYGLTRKIGLNSETLQSFQFVVYGYTGYLPNAVPLGMNCAVNSKPAKNFDFHWHWLPTQPNPTPGPGKEYNVDCD